MAIVTSKFRVHAASSFATSFTANSIYLLLGRPQPWDDTQSTNFAFQAAGTVSDSNPPNPADNWANEYAVWRDAMAIVKINSSDVRLATNRNNWIPGTRFDMYRHDIGSAQATSTGKYSLDDSNMIVYVTSTGAVYKCLYNGTTPVLTTGVVSTVQPTATTAAPQITGDGYKWKYLYTITAADADFITSSYIPLPVSGSNVSSVNGIDVILATAGGSGYASTSTITIYGDGTGATATLVTSAGVVVGATITNAGSGYTWAKAVIGSPGTGAQLLPIIAPTGGHASNFNNECIAHNVMMAPTVSGYQANDVPVNQDFRSIAIIANPAAYVTSQVTSITASYTGATGMVMRTLTMTSTATTAPSNDITLTGASSGAQALFIFQSSGTVSINYIQPIATDTSVVSAAELTRIDTVTTKRLKQFTSGETVTGTNYSKSNVGITTTLPEVQPYSGSMLYLDNRQAITRSVGQNEKINIVINF